VPLSTRIIAACIRLPNGEVYVGRYHGECFMAYTWALETRYGTEHIEEHRLKKFEQGFMDNLGRYKNRCAAYRLAEQAKQLKSDVYGRKPDELLPKINGRPQLDSSALKKLDDVDISLAQRFANEINKQVRKFSDGRNDMSGEQPIAAPTH